MGIIKGRRLQNNTTRAVNTTTGQPKWYLLDANNLTIGELANRISIVLQGKNEANYTPNFSSGNHVVVTNAEKMRITLKKQEDKQYYWHSWYPGGIKNRSLKDQLDIDASKVIIDAVRGMLPKNKLARSYVKNLHIFNDDKHNYEAQKPQILEDYFKKVDGGNK